MRYNKQCTRAAGIKQDFSEKLESFWETNFSCTLDKMGVIDMGRLFCLSGGGVQLGMAVTLTERRHSWNDLRRMSLRKMMRCFGVIISATFFCSRGNTVTGSTPPYVSRSRSRRRRSEVQKAKELPLDWGKQDEGVTNCSRHCLLSNWEPRSQAFSAGATTKTPPGPLRAGIERFTVKIQPFNVSHHLSEQVECFRVFLVRSLCDSLAAP